MLRNLIQNGSDFVEIYKIDNADMLRGTVVTKDYTNKIATKASGVGVEIYFLDSDAQPTGIYSDVEQSDYLTTLDTVKANALGLLVKPQLGETWATDQVITTGFSAGDYAIAGTTTNVGKLVKATTGNVSVLRYVGTYDDAGHTLYAFEVVPQKTV